MLISNNNNNNNSSSKWLCIIILKLLNKYQESLKFDTNDPYYLFGVKLLFYGDCSYIELLLSLSN